MSKVGNLRAMFENKGETSPPERGRSPGGLSTGTESPRPLSKIRTNFVAIEKDGRIGLQRDPSTDSILSTSTARKTSGGTEGEAAPTATQEKPPSFTDRVQKAKGSGLQMETIPQSPLQDNSCPPTGPPSRQEKGQAPGKDRAVEDKSASELPAEGQAQAAAEKVPKPTGRAGMNGSANAAAIERDKVKAARKSPSKVTPAPAAARPVAKPSAISTAKPAATKPPGKSPTLLKTPTSPAKVPKLPIKTAETKGLHPEKPATPKAAPSTAAISTPKTGTPSLSKAGSKPPALHASPSNSLDRGIGFIKPKVKSPTRPVTLPQGLTTHTAASATRVNASRQSLSRQSGSYQMTHGVGRSPSRASVSTTTGPRAAGTLKRQRSTINPSRPSLGPPPKPAAQDHPVTRREVDDGFLARMMRPTQASSLKTHEKAVTPPRKTPSAAATAKRPAAKDSKDGANPAKKAVHKTEAVVKKIVPKATLDALASSKAGEKSAPNGSPVSPVEGKTAEPEPVVKEEPENVKPISPQKDVTVESAQEHGASSEVAEAAEPVSTGDAPAVITSVDAAHEEEAASAPSEAEPAEPDTPGAADAVSDVVEVKSGEAQANGSLVETKLAGDGEEHTALGTQKREDDTTVAAE